MSGKINGVSNSQPASAPSAAGQRAPAATTQAAGSPGAADSVQITDTASHLVTAEQALNNVPVVSQGRVTRISESLADGTYKVSSERVADKLLQFERLLPADQAEADLAE